MRHLINSILVTLSLNAYSQCEEAYFSFEKGKSFEYTVLNMNEEQQGSIRSEITNVTGTLAFIKTTTLNDEGRETGQETFTVSCDKGDIQIDINQYVPQKIREKFKGKKVEIDGNFIIIPRKLNAGQKLPDGEIVMKVDAGPRTVWEVKILIKDRLVETDDIVTSSAGTFETFKIIERVEIEVDMGSLQEFSAYSQFSWYAKNIGVVKKGRSVKLTIPPNSYELLTKID